MPTTYKILSNILLSRLTAYTQEIIGDHQCGFQLNRSAADHIFCNCQILETKWEYNEKVHQLFIDFNKVHDSVGRIGHASTQNTSQKHKHMLPHNNTILQTVHQLVSQIYTTAANTTRHSPHAVFCIVCSPDDEHNDARNMLS